MPVYRLHQSAPYEWGYYKVGSLAVHDDQTNTVARARKLFCLPGENPEMIQVGFFMRAYRIKPLLKWPLPAPSYYDDDPRADIELLAEDRKAYNDSLTA